MVCFNPWIKLILGSQLIFSLAYEIRTSFFTTNSVIWAYGGSGVGKTLYALNRSFSDPKICYIACSALPIVDFECAIENALNEVVVIFDDTDIFLKKSRVEKSTGYAKWTPWKDWTNCTSEPKGWKDSFLFLECF